MKSRLIDPVHFFDANGRSVLTKDYQTARIAELEAEVERLNRLLKAQIEKYRAIAQPPVEQKPVIH